MKPLRADPDDFLLAGLPKGPARAFKAAPLFTDFCKQIGVQLEPGQWVITRVCYDGIEPKDLEGPDRGIAYEVFGNLDVIPPAARRIVLGVAGARGGKTYVLGALRILHLALTVPLTSLAPGQVASGPIIAPDKDLAFESLRYVQGAVASHPGLAAMVVGKPDAAESIDLARDGRVVEIVVRAASGKGSTGRGRSLFGFEMGETAFFRDSNYQVNDAEIFKALSPRLLPGAQGIVDSTPWAQVGLLYDLFVANHPNPAVAGVLEKPQRLGTAIAFHATTLRLRDTELTRAIVAAEEATDPENATREFGAQFMGASAETFFDPLTLARCIDDTLVLPLVPEPGDVVASGGDLGFAKNSSALAITHRRDGQISLAELLEKRPQEGAALVPSAVCREYAETIVRHHGSYLMADGHYKQTAIEHVGAAGLGFVDAPTVPAEAFIVARTKMRETLPAVDAEGHPTTKPVVRIPNHPRLIRQLRETLSRRGSGGTLTIVLPKWRTGEHGDLAQAFVLSIFQQSGERVPKPPPPPGSVEADEAAAMAAREKRRMELQRGGASSARERWRPGQR